MKRFHTVAVANIFSGLLIPISVSANSQDILSLLPEWVSNEWLYAFGIFSILCGLFALDRRFYRASLFFVLPLLIWSIFAINLIFLNRYSLSFANYFSLTLLIVVRIYQHLYDRKLLLRSHQWIGVTIVLSAITIFVGNQEIGAVNDFIMRTSISHELYALFLGIFGIILIHRPKIRLSRTVLMLSLPMIIQYFYVILYLIFIGDSKVVIPLLILYIATVLRIAGEFYDVW